MAENIFGMEISATSEQHYQPRSLPRRTKKLEIFGSLPTTVMVWMLTHEMSTPHVLLMHLSSGNLGLLRGEFQAPKFSSQSDLTAPVRLTLGFAPNF